MDLIQNDFQAGQNEIGVALFSFLNISSSVSCAPNNPGLDSGLFTGKPCKLPCWNGLTPGVSTFNDVNQFMQGLSIKQWPAREIDVSVYEPDCTIINITDRPGMK